MPRVLIDVNPLLKPQITGVGVYTGELLRHLCSSNSDGLDWGFYYDRARRHHTQHIASRLAPDHMMEGFRHGMAYWSRSDSEFDRLASRWVDIQSWLRLRSRKWRVFHSTHIHIPPLPPDVIGIVTIHDLLFQRFPEFGSSYLRDRWRARVAQALKRAHCIIAISEATAEDIERLYKVERKRIRVIYQGVGEDTPRWLDGKEKSAFRERWGLPERFLLFIGTCSAHKNVLSLMTALSEVSDVDLSLVVAGRPGDASADIASFLDQCPRRDRIRIIGYVDDKHLGNLYQLATAFVFPSLHEGFGLPVLEAMKHRLPVITSNNSSLKELFADCALLIDPANPSDIATAINTLLADDSARSRLIATGERKAQLLTWRRTAAKTRDVYEAFL